jgi:hypothetical protein
MAKLLASALIVAALAVTHGDRLSRRFRMRYAFDLPNRGERRAQGNFERAS